MGFNPANIFPVESLSSLLATNNVPVDTLVYYNVVNKLGIENLRRLSPIAYKQLVDSVGEFLEANNIPIDKGGPDIVSATLDWILDSLSQDWILNSKSQDWNLEK